MTQVLSKPEVEDVLSKVSDRSSIAPPYFLRRAWQTLQKANSIAANDDELGCIKFTIVRPMQNLTCFKVHYIDTDGEPSDSYLLSQITLIESSGNRNYSRVGLRLQKEDDSRICVVISADPELLLAYLSF